MDNIQVFFQPDMTTQGLRRGEGIAFDDEKLCAEKKTFLDDKIQADDREKESGQD